MDNRVESPVQSEFANKIKLYAIGNRDENGAFVNGSENLRSGVINRKTATIRMLVPEQYENINAYTRLAKVPLSATDQLMYGWELPEGVVSSDVAIVASCQGLKVDRANRNGVVTSVLVFDKQTANKFVDVVREDPALFYKTIIAVNQGAIQKHDGTPMEIAPGKKIEFVSSPNDRGFDKDFVSKPFPEAYKPNI